MYTENQEYNNVQGVDQGTGLAFAFTGVLAQAYEQGDWVLRVGTTTVAPESDSDKINLPTGLTAAACRRSLNFVCYTGLATRLNGSANALRV